MRIICLYLTYFTCYCAGSSLVSGNSHKPAKKKVSANRIHGLFPHSVAFFSFLRVYFLQCALDRLISLIIKFFCKVVFYDGSIPLKRQMELPPFICSWVWKESVGICCLLLISLLTNASHDTVSQFISRWIKEINLSNIKQMNIFLLRAGARVIYHSGIPRPLTHSHF